MQNSVTCVWKEPNILRRFQTGVSLHGHTSHSHESLSFIPIMAEPIPFLRRLIAQLESRSQRTSGVTVDFAKGYWTPPLPPLAAFQIEREQIEQQLNLAALVSLTDHDNIEAPLLLRVMPESQHVPVSLEWSVPYRDTVLHLGVHNLPATQSEVIVSQLRAYTAAPSDSFLGELLIMLENLDGVLIVLNHPFWDLPGIGSERHMQILGSFMKRFGSYLHALELGGLRSWKENREVMAFAQGWNQLVIAGGDRHGCEPSAVINVAEAQSFSEFAYQVRKERRSHILVMPQYREPLPLRLALSVLDVMRDYPDYSAGSRRWDERVFHPDQTGEDRPLAEMWRKPPALIQMFARAVHMLESSPMRLAMKLAFGLQQPEPRSWGSLEPNGPQFSPQRAKTGRIGSPFASESLDADTQ